MEDMTGLPKKRNEITHAAHRKENFLQIVLPMSIGILIILGLGVWAIVAAATGGSVRPAADVSVIFLTIPTMIAAFIFLVISAAFAYGIIWLNRNLPPYAKIVQDFFRRVQATVRMVADRLAEPVIRTEGAFSSLKALGSAIARPFKQSK